MATLSRWPSPCVLSTIQFFRNCCHIFCKRDPSEYTLLLVFTYVHFQQTKVLESLVTYIEYGIIAYFFAISTMQCFRICCQTYCISLLMFYSIVHFRISCFGKPFSTNFTGGWGRGERSSRGWVSCWPFLLCENSPHRFAYLYLIGDKWQFSTQDVWPITLPTSSTDLTEA